MTEYTAEQREADRQRTPYFTVDRTGAETWVPEGSLEDNREEFVRKCGASSAILVRKEHWSEISGSTFFVNLMDPATTHAKVLDGELGVLVGADVYTDAFIDPSAKDEAAPAIIFIPRR